MNLTELTHNAVDLLENLISIQSYSEEEDKTADLIFKWLQERDKNPQRYLNNVYAIATNALPDAPIILLNSHHDTVKFGEGWLSDPFIPTRDGDKITGLGANDAGGSVVSLLATFEYLSSLPTLPYQLMVAITAEEETSGKDGIEALLKKLPVIDLGIVGEPTEMKIAISERGLMVLDVEVKGKTGHAARNEGENAIYKALQDIEWFQQYTYEKTSDFLGKMKMTVTQISSGIQHNVVPDLCTFVVDIRINDCYTHEEVLDIVQSHIKGTANARSMRLRSSRIAETHPFIVHAQKLNFDLFGSATMSDQAFMSFNTIKLGPGVSQRSHTPNEFIKISEIQEGIKRYIELLEGFKF